MAQLHSSSQQEKNKVAAVRETQTRSRRWAETVNNSYKVKCDRTVQHLKSDLQFQNLAIGAREREAATQLSQLIDETKKHDREKLVFDIEFGCHHPDRARRHIDKDIEEEIAKKITEAKARRHVKDYDKGWSLIARENIILQKTIMNIKKRHRKIWKGAKKQGLYFTPSSTSDTPSGFDSSDPGKQSDSSEDHTKASQTSTVVCHVGSQLSVAKQAIELGKVRGNYSVVGSSSTQTISAFSPNIEIVSNLIDRFERRESARTLTSLLYQSITEPDDDDDDTSDGGDRRSASLSSLGSIVTQKMTEGRKAMLIKLKEESKGLPLHLQRETLNSKVDDIMRPFRNHLAENLHANALKNKTQEPQAPPPPAKYPHVGALTSVGPGEETLMPRSELPHLAGDLPDTKDKLLMVFWLQKAATRFKEQLGKDEEKNLASTEVNKARVTKKEMTLVKSNDPLSTERSGTLPDITPRSHSVEDPSVMLTTTMGKKDSLKSLKKQDSTAGTMTVITKYQDVIRPPVMKVASASDNPPKIAKPRKPKVALPKRWVPGASERYQSIKHNLRGVPRPPRFDLKASLLKAKCERKARAGEAQSDECDVAGFMAASTNKKLPRKKTDKCPGVRSSYVLLHGEESKRFKPDLSRDETETSDSSRRCFCERSDKTTTSQSSLSTDNGSHKHYTATHGVCEGAAIWDFVHNAVVSGDEAHISAAVDYIENSVVQHRRESANKWQTVRDSNALTFNKRLDTFLQKQGHLMEAAKSPATELKHGIQRRASLLKSAENLLKKHHHQQDPHEENTIMANPEQILTTRYLRLTPQNKQDLEEMCIKNGIEDPEQYAWELEKERQFKFHEMTSKTQKGWLFEEPASDAQEKNSKTRKEHAHHRPAPRKTAKT